jgi:hypothetical protein
MRQQGNSQRESLVGIATSYGLNDQGVAVRVLLESRIFSFHVIQTGSWAHTASYLMGTVGKEAGT